MDNNDLSTGVIAFFALKELWQTFKSDKKEIKEITKTNTEATMENTLAIVKLQVQIESLVKATESLPKLQGDIDHAHRMIRELRDQ